MDNDSDEEDEGTPSKRPNAKKCSPVAAAAAAAKAAAAAATLAAAAAGAAEAEPRCRARSRAGSVCAVDDAIGSIRIDDDDDDDDGFDGDDGEAGEFARERSLGAGSDSAAAAAANAADTDDAARRTSSSDEANCFYFQRHAAHAHNRPATVAEACLELDLLACDESAADVLASGAPKQQLRDCDAAAVALVEEEEQAEAAATKEEERALAAAAAAASAAAAAAAAAIKAETAVPAPLSHPPFFEGNDVGDSESEEDSDEDEQEGEEEEGRSLAREAELRELLGNLLDAERGARPDPGALLERHGPPPAFADNAAAAAANDDDDDFNGATPVPDVGGGGGEGDEKGIGSSSSVVDHLDSRARALTVAWLAEVASASRLHPETLHLAVSLLDRFLSASPARVPRRALQLAAAAAALIAAKHEGEEHGGHGVGIGGWNGNSGNGNGGFGFGHGYGPTPARLAAAADHCFSAADIARMEGAILQALGFRVGAPTAASFSAVLWRLAGEGMRQEQQQRKAAKMKMSEGGGKGKGGEGGMSSRGRARRERARASYLLELALLDNSMLEHAPSALAAAAMLLACEAEAEAAAEAEDEGGEQAAEEDPRCAAEGRRATMSPGWRSRPPMKPQALL